MRPFQNAPSPNDFEQSGDVLFEQPPDTPVGQTTGWKPKPLDPNKVFPTWRTYQPI